MITCPQYQATLPDGAYHCQYCGLTFGAAPTGRMQSGRMSPSSPAAASKWRDVMPGAPRWALPVYYAIAAWWMLSGVWDILQVTALGEGSVGLFDMIVIAFGAITALIGLGLILRVDEIRDFVNILCFLQILFGLLGIVQGFLLAGGLGMLGIFVMVGSIIDVLTGFLMIYLLGETDTRARDI